MSSKPIPWKNIALLSFPLWGTVLTVWLSCITKTGDFFIFLGMLAGVASGSAIFLSPTLSVFEKIILSLVYYFIGLFVVFFLGWVSICWFCPSCH